MITIPREETWYELSRAVALNTRSVHLTFVTKLARLTTKDRRERSEFYWANRDILGWAHWIQAQKREAAMHVIQLSDEGLKDLLSMMSTIVKYAETVGNVLDIRVGIDPEDNGVKFSVNGQVWSPPAEGEYYPHAPASHTNPAQFVARGAENIARIEGALARNRAARDE